MPAYAHHMPGGKIACYLNSAPIHKVHHDRSSVVFATLDGQPSLLDAAESQSALVEIRQGQEAE